MNLFSRKKDNRDANDGDDSRAEDSAFLSQSPSSGSNVETYSNSEAQDEIKKGEEKETEKKAKDSKKKTGGLFSRKKPQNDKSFDSTAANMPEKDANSSSEIPSALSHPPLAPIPERENSQLSKQEHKKSKFFQVKTNKDNGKASKQPSRQVEIEQSSGVDEKKKKKPSIFSRKKNLEPVEAEPAVLNELPGNVVAEPTLKDLYEYRNITYPVKEPFQFVNITYENGEVIYNVSEPRLTEKEKKTLQSAEKAYDMLVNTDRVLVNSSDKAKFVEEIFADIVDIHNMKLTPNEYQRVLYFLSRNYVGYGPIDALMSDRFIEDISCNGPDSSVYVYHRAFESIRTNVVFGEFALNSLILRLAQISGRHISILQPIRDAALPDGSRINMTMGKEVTKRGATFTIRKFRSRPISPIELINLNTVDYRIFAYLWILTEYGSSILISGGTAAGKTTMLNAISMLIRHENKIVSIEDTPEINLVHPNWIQAVTRIGFGESGSAGTSGISGVGGKGKSAGDINLYDLLVAALRQRPEYIVVGEVRGEEAYTLFQAISVGHSAMGTIHAASMGELLARVESPPMNVPRVLLSNTNLVIFVNAVKKGDEKVRRIREIVEILGIDPETKELITNTAFRWDPVNDTFEFTGRSFLLEKVCDKIGIRKEKLYAELENRTLIFEWMSKKGVSDYKEVSDLVKKYYKDPGAILDAIKVR